MLRILLDVLLDVPVLKLFGSGHETEIRNCGLEAVLRILIPVPLVPLVPLVHGHGGTERRDVTVGFVEKDATRCPPRNTDSGADGELSWRSVAGAAATAQ